MRILHTSDWHLGHSLYNYDRSEEQQSMLRQIVNIVREQQPDALILSGDVYDNSQPSAAVQTMFSNAMVEIAKACPSMVSIVTAGNHDSGTRHEIFREPWKAYKVCMIGDVSKDEQEYDNHIFELPDKGYIVAVPYTYERNMPDNIFQKLLDKVNAMNINNLPVIMSAHLAIKGCNRTGHEGATDDNIGGINCNDISYMGQGYDYLALGHIHREQYVGTSQRVRYSGTPLDVSFDEDYPHTVSIIDIDNHGDIPKLTPCTIENIKPLVTLPQQGFVSWEDAKKMLTDYPCDIPSYIRLNVEVDDFLPIGANAEANILTKNKKCRFCLVNVQRKQNEADAADKRIVTISEFQNKPPIEIARQYVEEMGGVFDDELSSMFNEVLNSIDK